MISTAFGSAKLVEQINVKQMADGKSFATLVELLETDDGEALVRIAYSTDGVARRGPVTVRKADLRRVAKALEKTPRLRAVIESEMSPSTGDPAATARARSSK
jgi:hypothetical protein